MTDQTAPVTPRSEAQQRLRGHLAVLRGRAVRGWEGDAKWDVNEIDAAIAAAEDIEREAAAPAATEALRAALQEHGWYVADVIESKWIESSEWVPVIRAALASPEPTPATGLSAEALRVLDNLLRHHNTIHQGKCEFARQAVAALASPEPRAHVHERDDYPGGYCLAPPEPTPAPVTPRTEREGVNRIAYCSFHDECYHVDGKTWREAAAPATPDSGLDVERLGEAGANVLDGRRIGSVRLYRNTITPEDWQAIATEYARLSSVDSPEESA